MPDELVSIVAAPVISGPQIQSTISDMELSSGRIATYDDYREVRRYSTVALGRSLIISSIVASSWSVNSDENVDENVFEFVKEIINKHRTEYVRTSISGCVDFGWQAFEIVHALDSLGLVNVEYIKPLLQDITTILVFSDTGLISGLKQDKTIISKEKILHVAVNVEGTQWYGEPYLEAARPRYLDWKAANTVATAYDKKLAGSHYIVHYPVGTTSISGVEKSNATIASEIINALVTSGGVGIPRQSVDRDLWKIEVLTDISAQQGRFIQRMEYLDKLLLRAILVPERAITEGHFGTKAESVSHIDMLLSMLNNLHSTVTTQFNRQVIDPLLATNFGTELVGKVYADAAPLNDQAKEMLEQILRLALANPVIAIDLLQQVDTDAILDRLGVPKSDIITDSDNAPNESDAQDLLNG